MGKFAQIVVGPAGSGKSTYCTTMHDHFVTVKRQLNIINLDPAAEVFNYPVSIDIRELINVDDVMEELQLGPNGGLIYCMEYLLDNVEWLEEHIADYADDYLIIDCPGQIELYTHLPIMTKLVSVLRRLGYSMCAVYMMDAMLIADPTRFLSGCLMCMSVMCQLELPHVSVLSKCDLLTDKQALDEFLEPDTHALLDSLKSSEHTRPLNEAVANLIEEYSMVAFVPLDNTDEDSISNVLSMIDVAIQFGEDAEPKDIVDDGGEDLEM